MDNITLLALIQQNLLSQGIDTEIHPTSNPTVELTDMLTETTIGVAKGETLEEAFATILGQFAAQSRDIKTGRNTGLSEL